MSESETASDVSRRFWLGFVAGWFVYFGISFFFAGSESGRPWWSVSLAFVNAAPPALVSVVVAMNRRRLFRPDMGVNRMLLTHAMVGSVFATTTALIIIVLTDATGLQVSELSGASFRSKLVAITMSAAFLYVVFAGVIMWSESIRRVRESDRAVAREAVLRAEAEAKAVRAQFNPHFVFNTLHSLMMLVRADPAAAEQAIEDVATLIRYASIIQRQDIDAVSLAKELEVARRYTALEQLRLGGRLEVTWMIEVDATAVTIPAFSLQTLVENAIKHGIEPSTIGGRVEVSARVEDEVLVLRVKDDGAGADPERVSARPGHGLGLLRRRLENRYGVAGRLSWSTGPGQGFEVALRAPPERPAPEPSLDVIAGRPPAAVPATA